MTSKRDIKKRLLDLEEEMGLNRVWEITDKNLKALMMEIAEMHASKVSHLTKHLAIYGYLYLKLLRDKDLRGYKDITQMRYFFLQKALERRFEHLSGEEAFELIEYWQRNGEEEDELTHKIREQVFKEHLKTDFGDIEEGEYEEEEEEDIDKPWTWEELEEWSEKSLREMLEVWILEDLDGYGKDQLIETALKWDKEQSQKGLVSEKPKGEVGG